MGKWDNGAPIINAGDRGYDWSYATWSYACYDDLGRLPLELLSISDIIQESQCILEAGVVRMPEGFGGGPGMPKNRKERCRQYFGAWKQDEGLRHCIELLASTGVDPDLAA